MQVAKWFAQCYNSQIPYLAFASRRTFLDSVSHFGMQYCSAAVKTFQNPLRTHPKLSTSACTESCGPECWHTSGMMPSRWRPFMASSRSPRAPGSTFWETQCKIALSWAKDTFHTQKGPLGYNPVFFKTANSTIGKSDFSPQWQTRADMSAEHDCTEITNSQGSWSLERYKVPLFEVLRKRILIKLKRYHYDTRYCESMKSGWRKSTLLCFKRSPGGSDQGTI